MTGPCAKGERKLLSSVEFKFLSDLFEPNYPHHSFLEPRRFHDPLVHEQPRTRRIREFLDSRQGYPLYAEPGRQTYTWGSDESRTKKRACRPHDS